MPIIPLVKPQLLSDQPAAVLDRQRRPTVQLGEQSAAVGRVAQSLQKPDVDPRPFSAPYEALGSVGEAIARTGSVIGALAEKRQEAITDTQIYRGQTELLDFEGKFREWKAAHPYDAMDWPAQYQTQAMALKEKLLANEKLTPQARERLSLHLDRSIQTVYHDVSADSNFTIFGEAKKAVVGNASNAIAVQDEGKFEEIIRDGLKDLRLRDFEAEHLRQQFKEEGQRQKIKARAETMHAATNSVIALGSTIGEKATRKALDDGTLGNYEPSDMLELKRVARQAANDKTAELLTSVANGMAPGGGIQNRDDLEAVAFDNKAFFTPALVEKANAELVRAREEKWAEERADPVKSVENAVDLYQKATDYDVGKDPKREEGFALLNEARNRTQAGANGMISRILAAKISGRAPVLKPDELVMKYYHDSLAASFNPKSGPFQWMFPKDILDVSGAKVLDTKTGKPEVEWVEDPGKHQAAMKAQADVLIKLKRWSDANPKDFQDTDKANAEFMRLLPDGVRKGAVELLDKTLPQTKPVVAPAIKPSAATVPERGAQLAKALVAAHGGRVEQWADRDIRGRPGVKSKHATGEAVDYYPKDLESGMFVAEILTAGGSVKRVIYNGRIWDLEKGWRKYTGAHEHKDHIHFEPI